MKSLVVLVLIILILINNISIINNMIYLNIKQNNHHSKKWHTVNKQNNHYDLLGLQIEPITLKDKIDKGIKVVNVLDGSVAEKNGVRKGDIITEVGKEDIKNVGDYSIQIEGYESGDTIMLRILRNGNPQFIAFKIE